MRKLRSSGGGWFCRAALARSHPLRLLAASLSVRHERFGTGMVLSGCERGSVSKEKVWHYTLKAASAKSGQDSPISGVPQEHKMPRDPSHSSLRGHPIVLLPSSTGMS